MSLESNIFLSSLPWRERAAEEPAENSELLVELKGCKMGKYAFIKIREGEGLGHIIRWCPYSEALEVAKKVGFVIPILVHPDDTKP